MDLRNLLDAMVLAMGLTPGLLVALAARMEYGMPVPVALLLGVAGAVLARRMLLAPVH